MFDIFLFLICRPWILKKINFILPTDRPKCFLRSARRTTNYFGTALMEISENLQNAWQNLSRHIVKGWEEMKWTSCSVLEIEKHNRWRLWHILIESQFLHNQYQNDWYKVWKFKTLFMLCGKFENVNRSHTKFVLLPSLYSAFKVALSPSKTYLFASMKVLWKSWKMLFISS